MMQQPRVVAAFDPGLATGYCIVQDGWPLLPDAVLVSQTLRGEPELFVAFTSLVRTNADVSVDLVVVCESFNLFPHLAREQIGSYFPSCEVIGMLKMLAFIHNTGEICFQQPSVQKNWPNEFFERSGIDTRGWTPHQYSAAKHAVQWIKLNHEKNRTPFSKKG